jgi:hypothetical protein
MEKPRVLLQKDAGNEPFTTTDTLDRDLIVVTEADDCIGSRQTACDSCAPFQ